MEIPDCSYADLSAPTSTSKERKRALDFEHSDANPNAELKKLKEVWQKLINEYQASLVDYFQATSGPK